MNTQQSDDWMSIDHVALTDTSEYTGELLHILMPTRGTVAVEAMLSFSFGWSAYNYEELSIGAITFSTVVRAPIDSARNNLLKLLKTKMDPFPKCKHWALWVDDDANPSMYDILALLTEMRRNPDLAILSCWYCPKKPNHPGWIPKFNPDNPLGNGKDLRLAGIDFTVGNIVIVPWIGLHCAMMRAELVDILPSPSFVVNPDGIGEDIYFSNRLRELKTPSGEFYKCAVHTGVPVEHIDTKTGKKYLPSVGAARE